MKKETITITTLGLLALLLCGLVVHLSCRKENDCSGCILTNDQKNFIPYVEKEKVIFKNDITNIYDTLYVKDKVFQYSFCSDPCSNGIGSVYSDITFTHLVSFQISVGLSNSPQIGFGDTVSHRDYTLNLNDPTQAITVNSTIYNDVYVVQVDSTTIVNVERSKEPFKIYYSKSQGFVKFFMVNGQTWSKL